MDRFLILQKSPLFAGLKPEEIKSVLTCLSAAEQTYQKGEYIFENGQKITSMGLVLSGSVHILRDDFWGVRNIIGEAAAGDLFGEAYACAFREKLEVEVVAAESCSVLFLNVGRVLSTCSAACEFHGRLIRNLLSVLAGKNLMLTGKIDHISKRTTREKLLSYLSAVSEQSGSSAFEIPYNRQQMADYLCVDRSAMSNELSRMQKEGLLAFHKNSFRLLF